MAIPEPLLRLLRISDSSKVLSVNSDDGFPHSIVLGSVVVDDDGMLYAGEVFMHRTAAYMESNPNVEFLVWKGRTGYSIRAVAEARLTEGPAFDKIKAELGRMGMDAVAAWRFKPLEANDESATPDAGDKVF